jgi:hypothetical protein
MTADAGSAGSAPMTAGAPLARILRTALPHLAATMPWGTLLGGCVIGLAISVVGYRFAGPASDSAGVTAVVRAAFVPLVLVAAFLAADPHRPLVAALPAPAWLTAATHTALALPVLAGTAALQLHLAAAELAAGRRYTGVPAHLPRSLLSAELAAAVAIALAAASVVARTRWHELGGAIAAPVSLAVIAATQAAWAGVTWRGLLVGALAVVAAAWAQRDPWLRVHPVRRRHPAVRGRRPAVRRTHPDVRRRHPAGRHRHRAVPRRHPIVPRRGVGK